MTGRDDEVGWFPSQLERRGVAGTGAGKAGGGGSGGGVVWARGDSDHPALQQGLLPAPGMVAVQRELCGESLPLPFPGPIPQGRSPSAPLASLAWLPQPGVGRAVARALGQDSQVLEVGPTAVTLLVRTTSLGLISSICKWVHALLTTPVCCDAQRRTAA